MWIVPSHKALFLAVHPFSYLLLISPSAVKILLLDLMHDFLPYNPVFPPQKYGIISKVPCHHLIFTKFFFLKKKRLLPWGSLYCYKITNLPGFPKEEPSSCLWIPSSPLYHICHRGLPFFFFLRNHLRRVLSSSPPSSLSFSPHIWMPAVAASPYSSCPPS